MKVLVEKYTKRIFTYAFDIDTESIELSDDTKYLLKSQSGEVYNTVIGQYLIFDTGDNKELEDEIIHLPNIYDYCIINGKLEKVNPTIDDILKTNIALMDYVRALEINQVEILYELSIIELFGGY